MIKSLVRELKDIDSKGFVRFYFNAFEIEDSDGDITEKGSFKKSMQENRARIKHFKNHNINLVPGVIKELGEDTIGAWAGSQLILKTQLGSDTYEEYKAGAITEHSFGFDVVKRDEEDKKRLVEMKLHEVSSLTHWGANQFTPVIDVKDEKQLLKELDKLCKLSKGDFTDDYLLGVETKINEILKHLQSLKNEPLSTEGPLDTQDEPIDFVEYLNDNLKFK